MGKRSLLDNTKLRHQYRFFAIVLYTVQEMRCPIFCEADGTNVLFPFPHSDAARSCIELLYIMKSKRQENCVRPFPSEDKTIQSIKHGTCVLGKCSERKRQQRYQHTFSSNTNR